MQVHRDVDGCEKVASEEDTVGRLDVECLNGEDIGRRAQLFFGKDERWATAQLLCPPVEHGCDLVELGAPCVLQQNQQIDIGVLLVEVAASRRSVQHDGL